MLIKTCITAALVVKLRKNFILSIAAYPLLSNIQLWTDMDLHQGITWPFLLFMDMDVHNLSILEYFTAF